MSILIADDHYVVRQGLKEVLRSRFESVDIGEASDGNETLQLVWDHCWDVVLLDISMPGRGGLDTLKEIKQTNPRLPVIILSMYPEDQFAKSGKFAGKTVGYVLALAESVLGGAPLPLGINYSDLSEACALVNENYDNGTNKGHLL